MRPDGRSADQLRPVRITPDYTRWAEGSVLVEFGETKVICTASVENKVPPFLEGKGSGWVTGEYSMLPRSTHTRSGRNPGGTRTAAVTGGWVALAMAIQRLGKSHGVSPEALRLAVAAVSTGIVAGEPRLDLAYVEDSAADTDFNFVMTDGGGFVEIQGTAEATPFTHDEYTRLVALAQKGAKELF